MREGGARFECRSPVAVKHDETSISNPPPAGLSEGSSSRRGDEKDGNDDGGDGGSPTIVNGEGVEEDFAEQQRRMMRVALARHMKRELIESEQDRLTKVRGEFVF